MTSTIARGTLYGWRPTNDSTSTADADWEIPAAHLRTASITERVRDLKDTAKLVIDAYNAQHVGTVDHGDRVALNLASTTETSGYGEGGYGVGPYGTYTSRVWTGLVRPYDVSGDGRMNYQVNVTGEDFVFGVLGMREVTNAFEDTQIVGGGDAIDGGAIMDTLLANNAPEIDRSSLPNWSDTTDITATNQSMFKVMAELANRADGFLYQRGTQLLLKRPQNQSEKFVVSPSDYGTFDLKSNDDELFNRVRVVGGTDYELDTQQTVQDGYTTVTQNTRLTYQFDTRKSEIDRIRLWTRNTGSGETLSVRLQADDNGAPVAPGDTKSDIARRRLAHHFISNDNYTEFIFPNHNLPPSQNPWLVVNTDGDVGQDIGIDTATGDPTYKSYYPYPVNVRVDAPDSQDEYRRRDTHLQDDAISTFDAARDAGVSYRDRRKTPRETLKLDAQSERMHDVLPGDVLYFDISHVGVDERYVCTERDMTFHDSVLETDVTFQKVSAL